MSEGIDLEYDPTSFVGPFDPKQAERYEKRWVEHENPFHLDPAYLEHLSRFHGGTPAKNCFRTRRGRVRVLERFLNFVPDEKKGEWGVYHVEVMRCLVEDRLSDNLLPFAALFAGDLLCFKYGRGGPPAVVVWLHEESASRERPVTEPVASSFDEFLPLLYRCEPAEPDKPANQDEPTTPPEPATPAKKRKKRS